MGVLRTCFVLFVVAGAWAQQSHPAKPPAKPDAPLTRRSFSARELHHEDDLTNFFVGNFADISFDRESMLFGVVFEQYLEAYARHCDAYLPANKVKMTRQVCADPPRMPEQNSTLSPVEHSCAYWRTISLGYADPNLLAAKAQLDHDQVANNVKDVLGKLGSNKLMGAAGDAFQLIGDMDAVVQLNACDGAGLRRFQDNVVLFSKGKPPLLLPAAPPLAARPPGGFEFFEDGCNAFYDDPANARLSMPDSKGWCRCLSKEYRNLMTPEEESKYANDYGRLFHGGIAQPWGYGLSKSDPAWPRLHPAIGKCQR